MDFVSAHHAKMQSRQVREPIEFPKWIKVDGQDVLALDAGHEAQLTGASKSADDEPAPVANLLSAPEKRGPGRPRLIKPE